MSASGGQSEAIGQPGPVVLSSAQRRAVEHRGGPLAVLAGPGAGKTRVIAERIAALVREGVRPESVVAVTFTIKAAGELRGRLQDLLPASAADGVRATTFHSMGLSLLRRFGDRIGVPPSPMILDSAQRRRLMRAQLAKLQPAAAIEAIGWEAILDRADSVIEQMRHRGISGQRAIDHVRAWRTRCDDASWDWSDQERNAQRAACERFAIVAEIYAGFEWACRDHGWITLDHLITSPTRMLREHADIAAIVRSDWRHLVVDEFQDVNLAQIELLTQLAPWSPSSPPDLCVVGDDDQSIYGFRGADDRAFARFSSLWPGHETVTLSENHRSTPQVVAVGNAVIGRATSRFAPEKRGASANPGAKGIAQAVELADELDDAGTIARMILMDRARSGPEPRPWSAYAVIGRNHGHVDRIGQALRLEGIPVLGIERRSPNDDEGVRDLDAWITLLTDPGADWAIQRLLLRPPISAQPEHVIHWQRAYLGTIARSRLIDQPEKPASASSLFEMVPVVDRATGWLGWLAVHAGEEPAVKRLVELVARVRAEVTGQRADEAMLAIVQAADLAHADLVAGAERSRRVANLVSVVRFVRARADRLDPPGDLASWKRYAADLRGGEAEFNEIALDGPAESVDLDGDGVVLITAHASKGLEFDTVFVPRVSPPHGYPTTRNEDDDWPEGLTSELEVNSNAREEPMDAKASRLAEERRVFYVACTRAKRRLVLLARKNKSPSKATHFLEELAGEPLGARCVEVLSGAQIEREATATGVALCIGTGADQALERESGSSRSVDLADAADRERRRARVQIAEAMARLQQAGTGAASLGEATDHAREALRVVAVASAIERGEPVPPWAHGDASLAPVIERLERARTRSTSATSTTPKATPLRLSYTAIRDYIECPGCYYLKHVLRLGEPMGDEAVVGVSVHAALEQFWRERRSAEAEGRPRPTLARLLTIGRASLAMQASSGRGVPESTIRQVEALLTRSHEIDQEAGGNVLEIERAVTFAYESGGLTHTFEAKLDRVDHLASGELCVIDYKTGRARSNLVEPKADDLQMGIYAMAAARLFGRSPVGGTEWQGMLGEYRVLQSGERGRLDFSKLKIEKVRAKIDEVIAGIVAGRFEPVEGHEDRPCTMLRL